MMRFALDYVVTEELLHAKLNTSQIQIEIYKRRKRFENKRYETFKNNFPKEKNKIYKLKYNYHYNDWVDIYET